jgi:hypothetical protein
MNFVGLRPFLTPVERIFDDLRMAFECGGSYQGAMSMDRDIWIMFVTRNIDISWSLEQVSSAQSCGESYRRISGAPFVPEIQNVKVGPADEKELESRSTITPYRYV